VSDRPGPGGGAGKGSAESSAGTALVVRRTIRATPEALFEAWTRPELLRAWWGPRPVTCSGAEVDLRVGGRYRIENVLPDGTTISIEGRFEAIDAPHGLVYTWRTDRGGETGDQRVTVRFEPREEGTTEVIVVHELIASEEARRSHEDGWIGCLDGLEHHLGAAERGAR
jgi:uncharacterized protein YndB with AHSA1/START domain